MRYIDEFRDKKLIKEVVNKIKQIIPAGQINIMEVCGTHTQSFCRFGLGKMLPDNLRLISGPGCPVCVSTQAYIDNAIDLARRENTLIVTFGDMLHIPGTRSTLEKERSMSGNVRVVYSAMEALKLAKLNPKKKVIFLSVGFETTAPTIALSIISAKKEKLKNLFFFSSLKLIPPAMKYLLSDDRLKLDGFLCPGHVSAIIGIKPYEFLAKIYKKACCVTGFEPLDILEGLYIVLGQIKNNKPAVANQYNRVVNENGNLKAKKIITSVFDIADAYWRGLGRIPKSGLKIRDEYSEFDAEKIFSIKPASQLTGKPAANCKCGDILKGLISPKDCPSFAKACRPENPIGPCMVSGEGACNAYYKYHEK